MLINFKEWLLEHSGSTSGTSKLGLYPPFYTGVYNYPPSAVINWGADAITYMDDKDVKPNAPYSNWGKFKPYFWHDAPGEYKR